MQPEPDYYKILQVHPTAEPEVIEAAYRRLARKYHPDVNQDPAAAERMRDLNEAYDLLSDPNERSEYDQWRGRVTHERGPSYYDAQVDGTETVSQREAKPTGGLRPALIAAGRWVAVPFVLVASVLLITGIVRLVFAIANWGSTPESDFGPTPEFVVELVATAAAFWGGVFFSAWTAPSHRAATAIGAAVLIAMFSGAVIPIVLLGQRDAGWKAYVLFHTFLGVAAASATAIWIVREEAQGDEWWHFQ